MKNIDDGTIFKYSIQRCINNTFHSLVIFSRVVPIRATSTATKDTIVSLSLELYPRNYIGNHMSLYMNMDDGNIFPYSIQKLNGNTINSLVTFSWIAPLHATNTTTTEYKILRLPL